MEKLYYKGIDYGKIVCAILVVCIHTGPLLSINKEMNFFLVQIVARIAVPFFFIASAFFFFRKLHYEDGLRATKNIELLKKYVLRLCKMYLLWSLLYLTIQIPMWIYHGFSFHTLLLYARDFLFMGSYYHLWFLPSLIFAVLFVYFLLERINIKKVLILSLILYIIGMFINVYGDFFTHVPLVSNLLDIYLIVFATARNGLFFGCIFVSLGYLIAKHESNFIEFKRSGVISFLISFALLIGEAYLIRSLHMMNDLTSMYLMLIPCVYFLFCTLLSYKNDRPNSNFVRNSSTLLYFSHCYIIFFVGLIPFFKMNSILYFVIVMLLSMAFIYGFFEASKKFKILRGML